MSKIGYARVSSEDQSLTIQVDALKSAGCSKIFTDTASGSDPNRAGFIELKNYLRAGDTLVITRIDRIARSVLDLQQLVADLKAQEIVLAALEQPISTDSASGKAFLDMLAVFAEFELNIRKERQAEGIAAAKAAGKYQGRKPISATVQHDILSLYDRHTSISAIARKLRISRNTVYKVIRNRKVLERE